MNRTRSARGPPTLTGLLAASNLSEREGIPSSMAWLDVRSAIPSRTRKVFAPSLQYSCLSSASICPHVLIGRRLGRRLVLRRPPCPWRASFPSARRMSLLMLTPCYRTLPLCRRSSKACAMRWCEGDVAQYAGPGGVRGGRHAKCAGEGERWRDQREAAVPDNWHITARALALLRVCRVDHSRQPGERALVRPVRSARRESNHAYDRRASEKRRCPHRCSAGRFPAAHSLVTGRCPTTLATIRFPNILRPPAPLPPVPPRLPRGGGKASSAYILPAAVVRLY